MKHRTHTILLIGILLAFGALLIGGCSANEAVDSAPGGTTKTANAPVSWNYVAIGDSLAAGIGANRGYVNRYADYIETDTGARVNVTNLGVSGETSSELLHALRNDASVRQALSAADVITFNIGFNDLGHAGEAYEKTTCGGDDNQDCLRTAVETFKANWNAVIAELLNLRSTGGTIIRTAGIGYTPGVFAGEATGAWPGRPEDFQVLKPYMDEVNNHIAATATGNSIPYVQVYLDRSYISRDGIHPNDQGYEVIAARLRELGYSPLG